MVETIATTCQELAVTCPTGGVVLIRIDRPKVHNALNSQVLRGLDAAVGAAAADPRTRAVVVTGTGKSFSAGADLDELAGLDAEAALRTLRAGRRVMDTVERCPVPVVAAVNGLALGGGFELVLACAFPVVAESAQLGLPESGLGLIPGYGGTQRLTRRVGSAVAAHAMLTGRRITADRAFQLGLTPVEPVPAGQVVDTAVGIADTIAGRGPAAVAAILTALRYGADGPLATGLELESALAAIATAGGEARGGVTAFLEKRPPRFADLPPGPVVP